MKAIILILITLCVNIHSYSQFPEDGLKGDWNNLDIDLLNRNVVDKINEYRSKAGLSQLTIKAEYQEHCKEWSEYLIKTGQYRHADKKPANWAGECLTAGAFHNMYSTYDATPRVESWKRSAPHWKIIMQPGITTIGVYTSFSDTTEGNPWMKDYVIVLLVGR